MMLCEISKTPFTITQVDYAFYQRMGVPTPRLCADERRRLRLMFRNERNLCKRKCDATGRDIISVHDTSAPFPVYAQDYWWSDAWDALNYGREIDFSRPFFSQFADLFKVVPQVALKCPQSENCEYTNQCQNNKDCYLIFSSNGSRDCYYGMWYQRSENCVDCLYLESSELCYEVLNGENCYQCLFCENMQNCHDCLFCIDCIGCSSCIGCSGLRNKSYYIDNKKCTKAEYEKKINEMGLHKRPNISALEANYYPHFAARRKKFFIGKNCEDFSGNYLQNAKNTHDSYNCRHTENIRFCHDAWQARNCYDLIETLESDFCLEVEGSEYTNDVCFSMKQTHTSDTWYSSHCFNSSHLFGCVGVRNRKYCILNREYTIEQFLELRGKLIEHMQRTNEWGTYFPAQLAPFSYNRTVAQEYYPLTKEQALGRGYRWLDEEQVDRLQAMKPKGNSQNALSDIHLVGDQILGETVYSSRSGRPFRIIKAELDFHRKLGLGLPDLHPDERHLSRMNRRAPRTLAARPCSQCGQVLQTVFHDLSKYSRVECERCWELTGEEELL